MTAILNSGSNPISTVTLGALADLGYQVDYAVATYTKPFTGKNGAGLMAAEALPLGSVLSVSDHIIIG